MNKVLIVISIILFSKVIFSQNIAITDDDSYSAHTSAMLDVKSITKGLLVPRLTTVQRNSISSPANGLLVYDTTLGGFYYYNGSSWSNLTSGISSNLWSFDGTNKVYLTNVNNRLGVGTNSPSAKMVVKGDTLMGIDQPLFSVVNKNNDTIFAVYDGGVRIYVDDNPAKTSGSKGGFAVGGYSPNKTLTNEYFRVTPDSVRIYIEEGNLNKSTSGKGGFAVGGFSPNKIVPNDYFNIYATDSASIINPSEARLLWYPLKEAFRSGKVLVESADSVGTNSFASGFESKAIGDFSQALGYQSRAYGDYSTAIGNYSDAIGNSSFAFGDGAIAKGVGSYAFGSIGRDTLGQANGVFTKANGLYSVAIGQGALSESIGSFSIGINSKSSGLYSLALGYGSIATGSYSLAIGRNCNSSGSYATTIGFGNYGTYGSTVLGYYSSAYGTNSNVLGYYSQAYSYLSNAIGYYVKTNGYYSTAIGRNLNAKSYASVVLGQFNVESGNSYSWVDTDPLFVVGNGTSSISLSNALTILKSGFTGIGTTTPSNRLHVVETKDSLDIPAILGSNEITNNYGTGVEGRGKRRGLKGYASTTIGTVYGAYLTSYSTMSGSSYGLYTYASAAIGSSYGIYSFATSTSGTAYAGYFSGNVSVTGTLSKGGGSFKIDHPLDPENKFLYHSFVESPDMKNIYDGVAVFNQDGKVEIQLPNYFEALNRDFRYVFSPIGAPMPNLYIEQEVSNNKFVIAGGIPGKKVSWQVTGIRKDPFAEQNRIPVEVEKSADERGFYLYPEVYNKNLNKGIDFKLNNEK